MRDIHVGHIALGYLLNEIVLNVAERDRATVPNADMPELLQRLAQWLRDEQKIELAEKLRDAADAVEARCVSNRRQAVQSEAAIMKRIRWLEAEVARLRADTASAVRP
jgi:hypothetical protein